jgi:hypothetical protein
MMSTLQPSSHPRRPAGETPHEAKRNSAMNQDLKPKTSKLKRRAMTSAALLAIAAGGVIVAVPAATGQNAHNARHPRHARRAHKRTSATPRQERQSSAQSQGSRGNTAVAALYLGLTPARVRHDLRSGQTLAQIAQTNGKSTSGLIDALVSANSARLSPAAALSQAKIAKLRTRVTADVNRVHTAPAGVKLSTAAGYLGVSSAQLHHELRSGETLAQIATATPGKSVTGLTAALIGASKTKLAEEVTSGVLTAKREKKLMAMVAHRVASEVARVPHKGTRAPRQARAAHRPARATGE